MFTGYSKEEGARVAAENQAVFDAQEAAIKANEAKQDNTRFAIDNDAMPCKGCGKVKPDNRYRQDFYEAEIHDRYVETYICDSCAYEFAQDI